MTVNHTGAGASPATLTTPPAAQPRPATTSEPRAYRKQTVGVRTEDPHHNCYPTPGNPPMQLYEILACQPTLAQRLARPIEGSRYELPAPLPPALLTYVHHLQDLEHQNVGFLTHAATAKYNDRGQLWAAHENDTPCGYIMWNAPTARTHPTRYPAQLRMIQIVIQYDAQRILHGTRLVSALVAHATATHRVGIGGWVASDIPANIFWSTLGFTPIATRPGGRKRNRTHIHWYLPLPSTQPFSPNPNPRNK